jgi:predicted nucleic acid-binding Zn ribbon protein
MSAILTRFGLYTILIVLAVFVLRENVPDIPYSELLVDSLLVQIGLAGLVLVVTGIVIGPFERHRSRHSQKKCIVCRGPVLVGKMYCRTHLREILEDEDSRRHDSIRR